MASLIYSVITSLDGYIEGADGKFDWAEPDEEVHAFVNDLQRSVGTYLYGRRMYETMLFWESPPDLAAQPPVVQDFAAIWQAADKIVYSKTLQTVRSAKTRIERDFDAEAVRQLRATARRGLTVGGPELAAQAIEAGHTSCRNHASGTGTNACWSRKAPSSVHSNVVCAESASSGGQVGAGTREPRAATRRQRAPGGRAARPADRRVSYGLLSMSTRT